MISSKHRTETGDVFSAAMKAPSGRLISIQGKSRSEVLGGLYASIMAVKSARKELPPVITTGRELNNSALISRSKILHEHKEEVLERARKLIEVSRQTRLSMRGSCL